MSEKKRPFDAAIEVLNSWDAWNVTRENFDPAICVLEDWPKWEPLIEAAGKVEWKPDSPETTIISRFDEATAELRMICKRFGGDWIWQERLAAVDAARALLESLPEKEKK